MDFLRLKCHVYPTYKLKHFNRLLFDMELETPFPAAVAALTHLHW